MVNRSFVTLKPFRRDERWNAFYRTGTPETSGSGLKLQYQTVPMVAKIKGVPMAASLQDFKSLIENGPDAVSLIDADGQILYGSASMTRLFGYQPEELLGRNCLEMIHPEDRDHSNRALQDVLAKPPGPLQWDARVCRKDGKYSWVESTVSNLVFECEVQAIVLHQRDINARKAAEAERQQHAQELAECNLRLEEFAYTAAHDLREPLRAISVFTDMLVRQTEMDANAKQTAKFIVDGAACMSTLVDDLLSFATTGMHEPLRCVDLRQAVAKATQNLALDIKATVAVVTVDRLPVVQSNEIQLVRLFQNLMSNAMKYRREDPIKIHVTAEQRELGWVIGVQDNGRGVATHDQAQIFKPFVRLAIRNIPGTGLGLAVCKKIVEGLGGTIWVESELGVGSTFYFTIVAGNTQRAPYRLSADILGIGSKNQRPIMVTIPEGSTVTLADAKTGSRMIDVLWEGETIKIFAQDLDERGILKDAKGATASA
jgi:PAS domain S-box-containing protein